MLTVKQLSKIAGVTPRTLRYYDQIGLLKPSATGENGYRYYDDAALLRLQQILLYRELELPLDHIQAILGQPGYDVLQALQAHRKALRKRITQIERLVNTVDQTIQHFKGNIAMADKQFFEGFTPEQEAAYEKEAMQAYDPEVVKASYRKWRSYSTAEKQRIGEEGNAVYRDFLAAMPKGPASPEAQAAVARWRRHMDYFWTPDEEQLVGLAELYNSDPRFKANYDNIHPDLAAFIREAVKVYVGNK